MASQPNRLMLVVRVTVALGVFLVGYALWPTSHGRTQSSVMPTSRHVVYAPKPTVMNTKVYVIQTAPTIIKTGQTSTRSGSRPTPSKAGSPPSTMGSTIRPTVDPQLLAAVNSFEQLYSSDDYRWTTNEKIQRLQNCHCVTADFVKTYTTALIAAADPATTRQLVAEKLVITVVPMTAANLTTTVQGASAEVMVKVVQRLHLGGNYKNERFITDFLQLTKSPTWQVTTIPQSE